MLYTREVPYLYSRDSIYYFNRRIPKDLQSHYRCNRIIVSLHTRSTHVAKTKSVTLAAQLDEEWFNLRWHRKDNPLRCLLGEPDYLPSNAPMLSDAKNIYVGSKGKLRPLTFSQAVERAVSSLINTVGDKPIDRYSRKDANLLRDKLFKRGLRKSSIKRMLSSLSALVNFVVREQGLPDIKTFSGIYLGDSDPELDSRRYPIPLNNIRSVQRQCQELNDEGRWLIALISDTGMRLSEAIGVHKDDIVLDHEYPHISLKPHSWRRLKTIGSERNIPLVGFSLWAVKQAMSNSNTDFLFPRYCNEKECKSNSASAALNKWLAPRVGTGCVVHSFRHSFRDRLRAIECPQDIADRLGGWSVGGIGESYGLGYPVEVLSKWMIKAMA